jgi:hypothetical protein
MDSRDGARRRGPIVVSGPLASFAGGLRRELVGQGYALDTIVDHVHLLADLSDWLVSRGLAAADLSPEVAEEFLAGRRSAGRRVGLTARAIAPILRYLRGLQIIPLRTSIAPVTPKEVLLSQYRRYLEDERGLSAGTVKHYLRCARVFLAWLPGPLMEVAPALSAGQVIGYVLEWTARRQGAARDMVTAYCPNEKRQVDFIHVLEYLWTAAWCLHPRADPAAETWVRTLTPRSRRRSTPKDLSAAARSADIWTCTDVRHALPIRRSYGRGAFQRFLR